MRSEEDFTAVDAVGDDAADEGEEEERESAEEGVEAEEEGGIGEFEDELGLRQDLHPGPDAGGAGTNPHEAEVAILKRFEDAADHDVRLFLRRTSPAGHALDCSNSKGAEL